MKSYLKPKRNKIIYLILLIIFFSKTSYSEEITGYAKVIDGDTIRIKGNKIRLYGIDAPENNQICSKPWLSLNIITFNKDYECGLKTTNLLKKFVKNEIIVCKRNLWIDIIELLLFALRKDGILILGLLGMV